MAKSMHETMSLWRAWDTMTGNFTASSNGRLARDLDTDELREAIRQARSNQRLSNRLQKYLKRWHKPTDASIAWREEWRNEWAKKGVMLFDPEPPVDGMKGHYQRLAQDEAALKESKELEQ